MYVEINVGISMKPEFSNLMVTYGYRRPKYRTWDVNSTTYLHDNIMS